ncbi:ANTAR domain-containing protein [Amycolatopsis sp. FDAARGOS 1241]|uniref:ANTAR domain-containing protein n=1 Tax=Amycolatopsis sp. FDAARGOS 1241 TaxID=2778070 RepID=UPI00194F9856|nr:ANTAR domain-containing protein [Amycolatopsis sp. FDAARGOS 1241]QRP47882.1 ANTAR domain-containing protein [Amycolatopsis sp. FDAARGOS 1241]
MADDAEITERADAPALERWEALRTRELIGQATGVLMWQRQCGPDEAVALLVKLSQDTNTTLREVARTFLGDFLSSGPAAPGGTASSPA